MPKFYGKAKSANTTNNINLKVYIDHMKNLLTAFVSVLILINPVYAHMEVSSVDDTMNSMMMSQNVNGTSQLDCSKISDHEFEELGDSVMDKMVGNRELHERMDLMMGGEGSESLKQMHITMGKNWLDCDGFQGMMGTNMMPMMMRMMGNYYPAYYTNYNTVLMFAVVGWVLLLVVIVFFVLIITGAIKIQKRRR